MRRDVSKLTPPAERPLSFATDMLRAARNGMKTQTRRPVYPQTVVARGKKLWRLDGREIVCPFGVPGDRLWVRERFAFVNGSDGAVIYSADPVKGRSKLRWQPSRYLPREASRVLLEVLSTRVEPLQSISEKDARAEGYPVDETLDPIAWFHRLWDRLTIAETLRWPANPWVWVVRFRLLDGAAPPAAAMLFSAKASHHPATLPHQNLRGRAFRAATLDEKRQLAAVLRLQH